MYAFITVMGDWKLLTNHSNNGNANLLSVLH